MYEESRDLLSVYRDYYDRPGRCHEEGRMVGRKEGQIEAQAELISQMATRKFDSRTGKHLLFHLKKMADPERVAEFGESVIECDDAKTLLNRAARAARDAWHPRERRHDQEIRAFDPERASDGEAREKGSARAVRSCSNG